MKNEKSDSQTEAAPETEAASSFEEQARARIKALESELKSMEKLALLRQGELQGLRKLLGIQDVSSSE